MNEVLSSPKIWWLIWSPSCSRRLELDQLDPPLLEARAGGDGGEEVRRLDHVGGVLGEERVETLLAGHEPLNDGVELQARAPVWVRLG